jgi:hypothetical protein
MDMEGGELAAEALWRGEEMADWWKNDRTHDPRLKTHDSRLLDSRLTTIAKGMKNVE